LDADLILPLIRGGGGGMIDESSIAIVELESSFCAVDASIASVSNAALVRGLQ
jgi:hypothetical protein